MDWLTYCVVWSRGQWVRTMTTNRSKAEWIDVLAAEYPGGNPFQVYEVGHRDPIMCGATPNLPRRWAVQCCLSEDPSRWYIVKDNLTEEDARAMCRDYNARESKAALNHPLSDGKPLDLYTIRLMEPTGSPRRHPRTKFGE